MIFIISQFKAASINALLAGFSSWVELNNSPDDSDVNHVDNAILLTRNGCEDGCKLEGLLTCIIFIIDNKGLNCLSEI